MRLVLIAFSFVLLGACAARADGTGVLPIDASGMGSAEGKLQRDVSTVLQGVLKGAYLPVPEAHVPDGALRCSQHPSCLQGVASVVSADEVVFVKATRPTQEQGADVYANLTLTLFSNAGAPLLNLQQTITNRSGIADLRQLIVRAFDPAAYQGRLRLSGLVAGDEVAIDGLRLDGRSQTPLRVGSHHAVLRHASPDAAAVDLWFTVPFEGEVTVEVPPAPTPLPTPTDWSAAPLWVHGATALGSVGVLASLAVVELWWRDSAGLLERGTCPVAAADGSGADFQNQGVSGLGACGAVQVELHQWVQLNRDLHLTLGIGMATAATVATTALVVTALTPSAVGQE